MSKRCTTKSLLRIHLQGESKCLNDKCFAVSTAVRNFVGKTFFLQNKLTVGCMFLWQTYTYSLL